MDPPKAPRFVPLRRGRVFLASHSAVLWHSGTGTLVSWWTATQRTTRTQLCRQNFEAITDQAAKDIKTNYSVHCPVTLPANSCRRCEQCWASRGGKKMPDVPSFPSLNRSSFLRLIVLVYHLAVNRWSTKTFQSVPSLLMSPRIHRH